MANRKKMTKPSQRRENPSGFNPHQHRALELGLCVNLSTFGDTKGQSKLCPCSGLDAGEVVTASKQLSRLPAS